MSENFNQLSPAQSELLACLAEECAEVIQVVGKILRHGYDSTHPVNETGPDNREMLECELGHVHAIEAMMIADASGYNLSQTAIEGHANLKQSKVRHYLHHNS